MFVYIKYDSDGWVTDFKKEAASTYTKVFIIKDWAADFMKYSDKFRYDENTGQILNPDNVPSSLTLAGVSESVEAVQKSLESNTTDVTKQLEDLNTSNQQMSAMLSTLVQAAMSSSTGSSSSSSDDDSNMSLLS